MSAVSVRELHKGFGRTPVLTGVDLEVPAGSLTAVLGPSGSGKTTLLRLIAGFERLDRGTIAIGGTVVDAGGTHLAPERRRIGYVPQEGSLFPHLTVASNVGFGLPRSQRHAVGDLLELVGLADLPRRYPHQLSGGQQQRVALARALAVKPAVVLLDEPFASLDAHLRASVRGEVQQILRGAGATAMLVTHDQDEALSMADHVAVMRAGRIAQRGSPRELYAAPVDLELAAFLGEANLIEGSLQDGVVSTPLGRLPAHGAHALPSRCAVTVLLRPEQIELHDSEHQGGGVSARVLRLAYHGHDAVVTVALEQGAGGEVVVRAPGDRPLQPGARVTIGARGPVTVWPTSAPRPAPEVREPASTLS
jgi:iron(III) transport system ATP-binding protein